MVEAATLDDIHNIISRGIWVIGIWLLLVTAYLTAYLQRIIVLLAELKRLADQKEKRNEID
jgi:hypothetical protein